MLFNSYEFLVFFVAVLTTYRTLPARQRGTVLLVASLIFYLMWIPTYLVLLLADVAVNYVLMRAMLQSARPRLVLAASVIFSLGLLAYFKYAAFLISALLPAFGLVGAEPAIPEILLPLGISFFTFQMVGLNVDVYRRDSAPPESFREYLLFLAFFPQLIAGPILRGNELLPQLRGGAKVRPDRDRRALWLITVGLAKKVLIADVLLAPYADRVFAHAGFAGGEAHLVALYTFAFQIYFDFSGYTDIARGIGLLMGFELPKNFMEPYLSRDPSEFWRRWHITLSQWLRDYLYIPLGGNRAVAARVYVNLILTMLLGGLWHGAGWNFLIWGGLHGVMLAAHRRFGSRHVGQSSLSWRDAPRIFLLFHVTCLLWVFFRSATFDEAWLFLERMFTGPYQNWPLLQVGVIASCAALHLAERLGRERAPLLRARLSHSWSGTIAEGLAMGAIAATVMIFGGVGGEFIYFQF